MKPIIGITADIDDERHYLNRLYVDAIARAGGIPLVLPAADSMVEAIDIIDGLLLSGGGDIGGRFFGQSTHEMATDIRPERDKAEIAAAKLAYARNMPILGICRGLQILNVALGGDLVQHIEGHKQDGPRNVTAHSAGISGKLAQIMGAGEVMVNTIHHQGADRVAHGLEICGRAPDKTIEALCCPVKPFVLAVQWHPEELIHMPEHFRIFEEFVRLSIR
jgi:gamma-glutamyl-gamma-aminobutyrate hydrolase PuuD